MKAGTMASNPEDDIHALWREQPTEAQRAPMEAIRATAQAFDQRTRRWRYIGAIAMAVLVVSNVVEVVWPGQDIVERTGDLLMLMALLYIGYEYRKHARTRPERLGQTTCAEFYRSQLAHERDLAAQGRRFLLPFVPGVSVSLADGLLAPGLPTAQKIGVVVAGVLLFVGVAWLNALTARKLQKQIDALDA
jgi:hypothetical protein